MTPTPETLVIVRCQRCGEVLGKLDTMPQDWSGPPLTVPRCRKCAVPDPDKLIDVLRQQRAAGFAMYQEIPLPELRPHALKAHARGKAVSVDVKPFIGAHRARQV
jgi:hypothetical protein